MKTTTAKIDAGYMHGDGPLDCRLPIVVEKEIFDNQNSKTTLCVHQNVLLLALLV